MAGRPRERRGPRPPIANKLRSARAARSLSQHAAAAELEIPPAVLAEYESGSRQPSGLAKKYLEAWAAACLGEPYSLIPTDKKEP